METSIHALLARLERIASPGAAALAALLALSFHQGVHAQNEQGALEQWASYHGGTGSDAVLSLATDDFGHLYVAGRTTDGLRLGNDTISPNGWTHQRLFGGGGSDAFLAKVAPNGSVLWCTYFGGPGEDEAVQVVPVGISSVYLVGTTTSAEAIATDTLSFQSTYGGGSDLFIAHFKQNGRLIGATYFGGAGDEVAAGAVLDPQGRLMVCGRGGAPNANTPDSLWHQPISGGTDGLMLLCNGTSQLLAGSFFGGEGDDELVRVVADSTGFVLAGTTGSTTGIATAGAFSTVLNGAKDAFLLKVDSALAVQRATYFGGEGAELAQGLALKGDTIALTGTTWSDSLYTDSTAIQMHNRGQGDGFLAVLDTSFQLRWSTFIGDTGANAMPGVAIDKLGRFYIAATALAPADLPWGDTIPLPGSTDVFLMRIDSGMQPGWGRYFGGIGNEEAGSLAVMGFTAVYLGGSTNSQVLAYAGHQMDYGGGDTDGFSCRLNQKASTPSGGICTGSGGGGGGGGGDGDYSHVNPPEPQLHLCRGDSAMLIVFGGALGFSSEWMWYADGCGIPEHFLASGDTIVIKPDHDFWLSVRAEGVNDVTPCSMLHVLVHDWPQPAALLPDRVCAGAPLVLGALGAEHYSWSAGDSLLAAVGDTTITAPLAAGPWALRLTGTNGPSCAVSVLDTVQVIAPPVTAWRVTDVACTGGANGAIALLPDTLGTQANFTFLWHQAGLAGPAPTGLLPGQYTVTVSDTVTGCSTLDTLAVADAVPLIDSLTVTGAACGEATGAVLVHTASTSAGLAFNIGNGPATAPAFSGLPPGTYLLTATDSAGCTQDTTFIIAAFGNILLTVAADTLLAENGQCVLACTALPSDSAVTYLWSPAEGLTDPLAASTACAVADTTTFTVQATSYAGCTANRTVVVIPWKPVPPTFAQPCSDFFLPDNFSPNGDGLNDNLCIMGGCITSMQWRIYDHWGGSIFHATDPSDCWSGMRNGVQVPAGSYPFTLVAERSTGEVIERQGTITLHR